MFKRYPPLFAILSRAVGHHIVLLGLCCLFVSHTVAQEAARTITLNGDELLKKVKVWHEPYYPTVARVARVEGPVEVELTIDEEGNVTSARVISGHPLLKAFVLEAAQTWKFNPIMVDGIAVRVQGRIIHTYSLSDPTPIEKTIDELRKVVREKPNSAEARYELGAAYFEALRYPEAVTQLTEAIRLDPKHAEVHLKLGHVYSRTHSYDKALASFTKASELDPDSSEPWHALGLTYMHFEKYEDAIRMFEKSLKVEGPILTSYFLIGKCYVLLERPSEAVRFSQQGLAKYPESDMGHYVLGEAFLMLKRYRQAIAEFQVVLKLSEGPGKSQTLYHLGLAYIRSGDEKSALQQYEILKKSREDLADLLMQEIQTHRKPRTDRKKRHHFTSARGV